MEEMASRNEEKLYGWWNDLNNDFIRLNQNYQDYMRELNSVKAEEMMKTREFLLFKDRIFPYWLRLLICLIPIGSRIRLIHPN